VCPANYTDIVEWDYHSASTRFIRYFHLHDYPAVFDQENWFAPSSLSLSLPLSLSIYLSIYLCGTINSLSEIDASSSESLRDPG